MPNDNQWEDIIPKSSNDSDWEDIVQPNPITNQPVKPYTGPTTFMGGAIQSLTSGEAEKAALTGGLGYLKGATLDIPSSIIGGIGALTHPIESIKSIPAGLQSMWELAQRAGSDPEAFGRMMGNVTGQPLVTAGLTKGIPAGTFGSPIDVPPLGPPLVRAAGYPVSGFGRLMQNYHPITLGSMYATREMGGGFTPFAVYAAGRDLERHLGRNVQRFGNWMKTAGTKTAERPPYNPVITEEPIPSAQPKTGKVVISEELPSKVPQKQLTAGKATSDTNQAKSNPPSSTPPSKPKPRYRANLDGTLTNMDTGEVISPKPVGDINLQPEQSVKPQFNPRGQKGMTGSVQKSEFEPLPTEKGESIADYLRRNGIENIYTTSAEALGNQIKRLIKDESGTFDPNELRNNILQFKSRVAKGALNIKRTLTEADRPDLERFLQLRSIYNQLGDKMPEAQIVEWAGIYNRLKDTKLDKPIILQPYKHEALPPEEPKFTTYILPDGRRVALDTSATKGASTVDFTLKGGEIVKAIKAENASSFGNPKPIK